MHAKAITGSYKRTACDTVKAMADLIDAAFVTTDGGPILTCKYAYLQAEAQVIRYTTDGTVPTATNGLMLAAGATILLTPAELRAIKIIAATAGAFANVILYSA